MALCRNSIPSEIILWQAVEMVCQRNSFETLQYRRGFKPLKLQGLKPTRAGIDLSELKLGPPTAPEKSNSDGNGNWTFLLSRNNALARG